MSISSTCFGRFCTKGFTTAACASNRSVEVQRKNVILYRAALAEPSDRVLPADARGPPRAARSPFNGVQLYGTQMGRSLLRAALVHLYGVYYCTTMIQL